MRTLADSILSEAKMVEVVRPCWISTLEPFNGMWHLSENGKPRGKFDAIVIAHNGKCANRLLAHSGLPLIAKQMKRLDLSSIWALLAAFDDPLPLSSTFEGAFVNGIDAYHGWPTTLQSCRLPKLVLIAGLSSVQQLLENRTRFHRGAALPTNTPGTPCIFDPQGRVGICGDWLLGSSLEDAALSGMSMASHIADYFRSDGTHAEDYAIGLHNEFQRIQGHDTGRFPGLEPKDLVTGELVQT
uniref:Uncharacterized protein n=1 Tax=Chenopodium quinoa TaxID=63459 RepID=A0A803NDB5_CHEQI